MKVTYSNIKPQSYTNESSEVNKKEPYYVELLSFIESGKCSYSELEKALATLIDSPSFSDLEQDFVKTIVKKNTSLFNELKDGKNNFYYALCHLFCDKNFLSGKKDYEIIEFLKVIKNSMVLYFKRVVDEQWQIPTTKNYHPLGFFILSVNFYRFMFKFEDFSKEIKQEIEVLISINFHAFQSYFGVLNPNESSNKDILHEVLVRDLKLKRARDEYMTSWVNLYENKNINQRYDDGKKTLKGLWNKVNKIAVNYKEVEPLFIDLDFINYKRKIRYRVTDDGLREINGIISGVKIEKDGSENLAMKMIEGDISNILNMKMEIELAFSNKAGIEDQDGDNDFKKSLLKLVGIVEVFLDMLGQQNNDLDFLQNVFKSDDYDFVVKKSPELIMNVVSIRKKILVKNILANNKLDDIADVSTNTYQSMINLIGDIENKINAAKNNVIDAIESETLRELTISKSFMDNKQIVENELRKRFIERDKKRLGL